MSDEASAAAKAATEERYELEKLLVSSGGLLVTAIGGGIALVSFLRANRWKRAELANGYLADLTSNAELVFACRALDWEAGRLVVPETLRPILSRDGADPPAAILHDTALRDRCMDPDLRSDAVIAEPLLQVYRTAFDSLLSWLALVRQALDRRLFRPGDVEALQYWLNRIAAATWMHGFIGTYGYGTDMLALARHLGNRNLEAAFRDRE
ncbi:hypothetical protein [Paracraurococcus ruber]|uniref:Uncharacterized protein n=1 Tax=Paracraurococcus ruber TaxID=77675 RepID=A0ABS1CTG2_9PROT|nr:hypothetical protein [Paracraurococcus ruber]MBK1657287.1 hypothetical protein [Paracraurococcus ruber]TDG33432.1 hypothetical protein E2C05_03535 [Paracraurococcus ruber]